MLGCGVALTPLVTGKDHGHLFTESAQNSYSFTRMLYNYLGQCTNFTESLKQNLRIFSHYT